MEELPKDIPKPRGKSVTITECLDALNVLYKITRT